MNRFLSLIFKELQNKSITDALPRLLSKKQLAVLASSESDPRGLVDQAIEITNTKPEFFLKRLSDLIRFPVYLNLDIEPVEQMDKEIPVARLERLGVYPLFNKNQIIALWAVDPLLAKEKLKVPNNFPIYLGLWKEIKNAWSSYESNQLAKVNFELKRQQGFEDLILRVAQLFEQESVDVKNINYELLKQLVNSSDYELHPEIDNYYWEKIKLLSSEKELKISFILDGSRGVELIYSYESELQELVIKRVFAEKKNISEGYTEVLSEESKPSSKKNVLLIDDSSVFSSVIKKYLKTYDYHFKDFVLAEEALRYLKRMKKPLDLIICDLHMPNLSGDEVLRQVRSSDKFRNTPFILLTSEKNIEQKIKLFDLGVDAYIGKDEDPRLVASQVNSILAKRNQAVGIS